MENYWDKSKLEFNIILPKRLIYQTNVHTDIKTSNICLSILDILYIVFCKSMWNFITHSISRLLSNREREREKATSDKI